MNRLDRPWLAAALALLLCLLAPSAAHAHDVADQLRLHAFVQASDDRVDVVLRLPLELMLNVDLPKRGNGYLDLARVDDAMPRALQAVARSIVFIDGDVSLALASGQARIALPSDRAFESFDKAAAAVRGERLPVATDVYWNQGYFDALLEYRRDRARPLDLALDLRVAPGLRERLRMDLRLRTASGQERAYEIATGSGPIVLDPRWHQAVWTFVKSGVIHILGGADHLLFLLCLVLPFRRIGWPLVGVVTAFTVAHSVTLAAAALGYVPRDPAFPLLVEALIAASIVYMAIDNLVASAPRLRWRWALTAAFGLVHGFGFSFALAHELQFAGSHLALSLLAFNVGIELGQLFVLALGWPLLAWVMARSEKAARALTLVIAGFVAHQAWHWLSDRFTALARADWQALAQGLAAPLAIVLLLAAAAWAVFEALRRHMSGQLRRR
jgi:HupE / UreJ protein